MMEAFREAAVTGGITVNSYGKRHLQSRIFLEMLKVDRERAIVAMKAWAEYLESSGRQHRVQFNSLEGFLEHRAKDAGEKFVFASKEHIQASMVFSRFRLPPWNNVSR
jgi:hypothetical protein